MPEITKQMTATTLKGTRYSYKFCVQDRNEKDVPKSKKRSAGKQHKVAPIALPMDVSISQKALILALLRRSRS